LKAIVRLTQAYSINIILRHSTLTDNDTFHPLLERKWLTSVNLIYEQGQK